MQALDDNLAGLARLIESQYPHLLCGLMLLDEDGKHIRHAGNSGLPESFIIMTDHQLVAEGIGASASAAFRGERVVAVHAPQHPHFENIFTEAEKEDLHACWAEPVFDQNRQLLGVFTIYTQGAWAPGQKELAFVEALMPIAAMAIRCARTQQNLSMTANAFEMQEGKYKQVEQEKQEFAAYNRSLIETIPDAIFLKDSLGRWLIANEKAKRLFHLHHTDWISKTDNELARALPEMHEVFQQCQALYSKAWHGDKLAVGHLRIVDEQGKIREFELRKAAIFDTQGNRVGLVGISRDITKYNRAEAALREAARFAQGALNALSSHIAILDEAGVIIAVNHAWRSFAEHNPPLSADVCEGANYLSICDRASGSDSKEARSMAEGIRAVMGGEINEFSLEYPCHGPEAQRWFIGRVTRFPGEGELRIVVSHTNITERKLVEIDLKHHRDHLQELVNEQTLEIRAREAQARRALAELEHQKFVLDQHVIVTVTDVQGRIVYANDKFCSISGYRREELLGQDHAILNSGCHPKGFFKDMYRTIAQGRPWHGEICNRAKDGSLYWVNTTIAAYLGDNGKPKEYISICTDITERIKAEKAAEAASRAKSEFLANMSHEIRTPMNGVVGMVDILQEAGLSREQHRMLRTIRDSALSLLGILDDILDFSKIEAGKLTLESIPVNLREVVEGVAQTMIPVSSAKDIDLHVYVSPELPDWIESDPLRLRQILSNLLSNAIKFTSTHADKRGQVSVRAELVHSADERSGLRIRVSDNGVGMSAEMMAALFQPFTQADESTTRRFGGTGLGLSITKRLVTMLQGQILVNSSQGLGAEFTVEIPLLASQACHPKAQEASLEGVWVTVIADNSLYAETVAAYLRARNVEVCVMTAEQALNQNWNWPDDRGVILLFTPDTECIRLKLLETGLPDSVKIVQLIRRRSSGVCKNITVPVNPLLCHDLIQGVAIAGGRLTIQNGLNHGNGRQYSRLPVPSRDQAIAGGRLILLAEDNETNQEVIQAQLNLLGYACDLAADGLEALEKWRSGQYALLLTDCHMPNMDGFQLTAAIRQEGAQGVDFPIVAVTANAIHGEAERCMENGMDDYLAKPIRIDELRAMLAKWLPATAEDFIGPCDEVYFKEAAQVPGIIWDPTALSRMVGDDTGMHRRLLEKFLLNAENMAAAISDAAGVGEPAVAADIAHRLKSASRVVGAMLLGDICQALETAGRAGDIQAVLSSMGRFNSVILASSRQIRDYVQNKLV